MKVAKFFVCYLFAMSASGFTVVNTHQQQPSSFAMKNSAVKIAPNPRLQAMSIHSGAGALNLAALLSKVKGKMVPTRFASDNRSMPSANSRSQAIIGRLNSFTVNKAEIPRIMPTTTRMTTNKVPGSHWGNKWQKAPMVNQNQAFNPYSKSPSITTKAYQTIPRRAISLNKQQTKPLLKSNLTYHKNMNVKILNPQLQHTRPQGRIQANHVSSLSAPRTDSRTLQNTNRIDLRPKAVQAPAPVHNTGAKIERKNVETAPKEVAQKRKLETEVKKEKHKERRRYLKSNKHSHDLSLTYHQNFMQERSPGMTITRALYTPKFARKLIQINPSRNRARYHSRRQLFAGSPGSDDDKRVEQEARVREIYRKSLSRAMNKYNFTEHVSHWTRDAVDEIHRLFSSGMREVADSKDFLIDKMDDIYNNFITPVRWNG